MEIIYNYDIETDMFDYQYILDYLNNEKHFKNISVRGWVFYSGKM